MKNKFLNFIKEADKISVITGAGISAESGIPTFRDSNGLWRNHKPEELATLSAFNKQPEVVWDWYNWRRELISKCSPNPAHDFIANLEKNSKEFLLVTQNVDGLHQRAGSRKIIEIHGSVWKIKCISCNYNVESWEVPIKYPPKCPICNNLLRPAVVWFGESLDYNNLKLSVDFINQSDLLIIIGTSGVVQPVASFPFQARQNNPTIKIIEINPYKTPITNISNLFIKEKSGEFLKKITNV